MKSNVSSRPALNSSCAIFVWVMLPALAFGIPKPVLINGVAATVGKNVITVQDAYLFRALQRFKKGEPDVLKPEQGEELRRSVQKIIFEEMVSEEIKSLKVDAGSRGEVEQAVKTQKAAKGRAVIWSSLLSRFGKTESGAIDRLFKSTQVEKFLQKKVETMTPIITQVEVERYIKQNEARLKGSNTENLRPNIVLLLKKQRMEKGLEEWVRFLRDKYGVANYLDG